MRECAGFGKPLVSSLPRPCIYPVTDQVELNGVTWDTCYWHGKIFRGQITDAGGRPLSWSPKVTKGKVARCGAKVQVSDGILTECGLPRDHGGGCLPTEIAELMGFLRREWDLAGASP